MADAASTSPASSPAKSMDDLMALCKRRGFIYQASEIYGGINGFWDYGPLGAQLKKNLRDAWWQDVVMVPCAGRRGPSGEPVRIVPLDTCIIQHPKVWEASGHVAGFNDPMVDDKETKQRFRADHLYGVFIFDADVVSDVIDQSKRLMMEFEVLPACTLIASSAGEAADIVMSQPKLLKAYALRELEPHPMEPMLEIGTAETRDGKSWHVVIDRISHNHYQRYLDKIPSPFTGKRGSLTEPRQFNLMFKTYIGATATDDDIAYLRPETAQGIFINAKNVWDTTRVKVPFGIAQTGKAFRNEVTPRNFTFRSREFEQMEIEFFCHPSESMDWFAFWRQWRMEWWQSIGLAGDNLRLYDTPTKDLAHYAQAGSDVEYRFPFTSPGFGELEGIAHRADFDLKQHAEHSGLKDNLKYFDTTRGELLPNGQPKGEKYFPHVIEPSAGLDRGVLAILCEAYTKDPARPSPEIMRFHPRVAPIKAAVFPLVNKDGMPEVAEKLHADVARRFARTGFIETDAKQSIGKRYARMDEAGCPFCFTIDGDTLKDQTVTVRDRDTGAQQRIAIDRVPAYLADRLSGAIAQ